MSAQAWIAVCVAATVSLVAPLMLRPALVRLAIVDIPNHRSSHDTPTIRGGGVAPLLGITVGTAVLAVLSPPEMDQDFLAIFLVSLSIGFLGFAEDLRGLPVIIRALVQVGVGAGFTIYLQPDPEFFLLVVPFCAVAFAANVNFTNFMDGINGISSLYGFVAGLSFGVIGILYDVAAVGLGGFLTAAVFLPFLPWNLSRKRMFLGDVGSYLLGGLLGAITIVAIFSGVDPLAALSPLAIYWSDAVSVIIRRILRGEAVFEAHRSHTYQRLTAAGESQLLIAAVVAILTLASSTIGIGVARSEIPSAFGFGLILAVSMSYLLLPRFLGSKQNPTNLKIPEASEPTSIDNASGQLPRIWAVYGASGFVGSALVEYLRTHDVVVRELRASRLQLDPGIDEPGAIVQLALSSDVLPSMLQELRDVDVVVNAAGLATPGCEDSEDLYGANSLLPVVIAEAAKVSNVRRFIHLSSAAVQGNSPIIDETARYRPFSPYSRSKARGEQALLVYCRTLSESDHPLSISIVRATSVQGSGRPTTESLRRIASSWVASVASPGDQPSIVSSVAGLVQYVERVSIYNGQVPPIVLQPWEGMTTTEVLEYAGSRRPRKLPRWFCVICIRASHIAGIFLPGVRAASRRLEVMWFGQRQVVDGFLHPTIPNSEDLKATLIQQWVAK